MRDTKYTRDGRKVVVVGKLNAEQSIVQEVFVSGDQEIPSGENFVVSTLLDAPAEPWKEKSLRELDERYDREKKHMEAELQRQRNRLGAAIDKARLRCDSLLAFSKNSEAEEMAILVKFLSGEITHFYIKAFHPKIVTWDDDALFYSDNDRRRPKSIKLLSLCGRSDGRLSYRLHHYPDGSGGCSEEIYPCCSYEEALQHAQRHMEERAELFLQSDRGRSFNIEDWEKIDGIVIPDEARAKVAQLREEGRQKRIEELRGELAKLESADEQ